MAVHNFDKKIENLHELGLDLSLTKNVVNAAMRRAIVATLRSAKATIASGVSKDANVRLAVIRRRLKIFSRSRYDAHRLSMITYAVPALIAGVYNRTAKGARIGRVDIPGSFKAYVNGRERLFKRRGKARYPIDRVNMYVHKKAVSEFSGVESKVEGILFKNIEREFHVASGVIKVGRRKKR